jgi:hypothetical protein
MMGFVALTVAFTGAAVACTVFSASSGDEVLVGNSEDWHQPLAKVWFVPGLEGRLGGIYFGFDELFPFGGMNEAGLFFDSTAAGKEPLAYDPHRQAAADIRVLYRAMAECSTVAQALDLLSGYRLFMLESSTLVFADRNGDAAILEGDTVVRKQGWYQVETNFRHSRVKRTKGVCPRYDTTIKMLQKAGKPSVGLFRDILSAVSSEGTEGATIYSQVYDLKRGLVYLYSFHDFENVVVFDLAKELAKGESWYDVPALFPVNPRLEAFAEGRRAAYEKALAPYREHAAWLDEAMRSRAVGRYDVVEAYDPVMPVGAGVTVARQGDALFLTEDRPGGKSLPLQKYELIPESPTRFVSSMGRLTLTLDESGAVTHIEMHRHEWAAFYTARRVPAAP